MKGERGSNSRTTAERLEKFSTPVPVSGCVLWVGSTSLNGYPCMRHDGRTKPSHRVSYELAKGPIPRGLVLDHLCRVPTCINPDHMEPVTIKENVNRGTGKYHRTPLIKLFT